VIRGLTLRAVVVSVALGGIVVGGFVALTVAVQTLRSAERADARTELVLATSSVLENSVLDLETGVRGYLLTDQPRFLQPYNSALANYPGVAQRLVRLTSDDRPQELRSKAIAAAVAAFVLDWAIPILRRGAANPVAIRRTVPIGAGKKRVDAIRAEFRALNRRAQELADARRVHLDRLGRLILGLGVGGVVLSAILIALSGLLMQRAVVLPVRRLAGALKRFGLGDLSTRVAVEGVAEVGELTLGFNAMADELEVQRKGVEEQNAELASLASRLRRSNAELEQFAAVASHDLREPLRKIQSFGGLLTRRFAAELPEEGVGYVERMCAAAVRMEILIDGVLDLSRATRAETSFERLSLDSVVRAVLGDLQILLVETGALIELGELPEIEADPLQMRQLFQNLIANALKFARPDVVPEVSVSAALAPGIVELTVSDNGIGFEEEHVERIFGPFQRLHGRAEYLGSGLGLALCRRIAERHGGSIVARATLGAGASFIVTLPVAQRLKEAA
jgi:signal transduction histidine kinase